MKITDQAVVYAAYMAVKHLSHEEAAKVLQRRRQTVACYRRDHPEAGPPVEPQEAPPAPKPPRPGVVYLAIPLVEPSRSSEITACRSALVTLPAPPPWLGITFDKQVTV